MPLARCGMRKYAAGTIRVDSPYGRRAFSLSARAIGEPASAAQTTTSASKVWYLTTTGDCDQIHAQWFRLLISSSFVRDPFSNGNIYCVLARAHEMQDPHGSKKMQQSEVSIASSRQTHELK